MVTLTVSYNIDGLVPQLLVALVMEISVLVGLPSAEPHNSVLSRYFAFDWTPSFGKNHLPETGRTHNASALAELRM